jgi:trimeric autotransporter adhesin
LGGFHGDGGPAAEAAFHLPEHLALDSQGNLYVCDNGNHRIRKIDIQTGIISTVFGTGQRASNGDGGPATAASTFTPDAIFVDVHDNLYVGEAGGCRLRKVDAKTGIVMTVAGTGVPGWGEEGLPGPETKCNPIECGIWVDADGTIFYSDSSGRLRRIDGQTGIVTTVLGGTSIHDGGPSTEAFLACPRGICVGANGQIYMADTQSDRIRAIDPLTGIMRTVAGTGARRYGGDNGPALEAYLFSPCDVAVDAENRIYIADTQNGRVRRVDEDGLICTVAGTGEEADRGDGGPAICASFSSIRAVAYGPDGNLYIGDAVGKIRMVDAATGLIRTVVGIGLLGYSGDGGSAQKARIGIPAAIRFDAAGNLYFADLMFHVVRKVDRQGLITTVAGCGQPGFSPDGTPAVEARLHKPMGLAVSGAGEVYVSDSRNHRVRRVTAEGALQTVAGSATPGDAGDGGAATAANLNEPQGLCFYTPEILLISDHLNNRIKAVRLVRV